MNLLIALLLAHVGAVSLYPDPARTPGATNPSVTQANIHQTICVPGYTATIRPTSSYTTALKLEQMKAWGLKGKPGDFEEDHFISLELAGNPTDPKNLWPEPYKPKPGAKAKDTVENWLHKRVCDRKNPMLLKDAQDTIASDWYAVYLYITKGKK